MTTPFRGVLLGPPASGKGTQGLRLAKHLAVAYLSTGALLRDHMERATSLGEAATPILARGGYLPDDLMSPMLAEWLSNQAGGWVLDGFPRSLPQAIFLDNWLAARGSVIDCAISLEVPVVELLARIENRLECATCRWTGERSQLTVDGRCPLCENFATQRADDTVENFSNRHAEFMNLTQPVIAHYRRLGLLSACDGTPPRDELTSHLLENLIPQSLL